MAKNKSKTHYHFRESFAKFLAKHSPEKNIATHRKNMTHGALNLGDTNLLNSLIVDQMCHRWGDLKAISDEPVLIHIDQSFYSYIKNLRLNSASGKLFHMPWQTIRFSLPSGGWDFVWTPKDPVTELWQVGWRYKDGTDIDIEDINMFVLGGGDDKDEFSSLNANYTETHLTELIQNMSVEDRNFALKQEEADLIHAESMWIVKFAFWLTTQNIEDVFSRHESKIKSLKGKTILEIANPPKIVKGEHYVQEFLRQLRDEKYYQGKWSHYPIGTRYTLVKGHLRGGNG